jgi:hypothetical protein
MACDGVIPTDQSGDSCPHCGEKIEGETRRYFNWVEIDQTPPSDRKLQLALLGIFMAVVGLIWFLLS